MLSRGENGPEVVARVTEAARRHIAIEQIDVAHQTGVEERCLIRGGVAAADQRAPARSPVFLELFAQRLEGLSWQCSDGAAKAVQNIALEKLPGLVRQLPRSGRCGKGRDSLDCGTWVRFRHSRNNHVRPSSLAAPAPRRSVW